MATQAELKAKLSLDSSLFHRGISLAHSSSQQLGRSLTGIGGIGAAALGKLAAAAAALGGVAGFALATKHVFNLGQELTDLSARTGISVERLTILQQAFVRAGLEAGDLGTAINRMQRFLANKGIDKFGDDFAKLHALNPEQQFLAIGQAISRIPDPAERAAKAMEIFGRGGGRLLAVFGNPQEMNEIQQSIGKQAKLLGDNAELFRFVSIRLKEASLVLRGFFVGVATETAKFLKPLLENLDKIDFTAIGTKFGAALVSGTKMLIGVFTDKALFTDVVESGFKGAALGLGNVLIAVFQSSIIFFRDGFLAMFQSLGDAIIGVLLRAFKEPIASFQANIELLAEAVVKNLHATNPVQVFKNFRAAGDPKLLEQRTQEILAAGPKAGFGAGETAEEHMSRAKENFETALDAAANAFKSLQVKDVLGAGEAIEQAKSAASKAIEAGGELISGALEHGGSKISSAAGQAAEDISFAATRETPPAGIVKSGTSFFSGISGKNLFKGSILNRQERENVISQYLAETGAPLTIGHDAMRQARKDAEKREVLKTLKAEQVQEKSVTLLDKIKIATEKTASAWEEQ